MKKILVIEDDPFIRENIYEVLELNKYKVFTASNGREGLSLAFEIEPDLIICDIMMPKMDGYEVKEALTRNLKTKSIPFIFLTAKAEVKELRYGMALGADDYITKPFEISDLVKSIQIRFEKIEDIKELYKLERHIEEDVEPIKNKILIRSKSKTHLVPLQEIIFIHAAGNYTEIFQTGNRIYNIRKNLKYWETHLPEKIFLRVHQSYLINTEYLEKIEKLSPRSYELVMKSYAEKIPVSQRHLIKLKIFFS
jgi:DNA-binding LytR/AlgR family response regulator